MNLLQGKWPRLATLLAVLVAAALVFLAWERYTRTPWTRDARVRADVVTLSADVSGLITRLPLSDNQPVEKGELLLSIDPARYELAVLRAERAVNVARAALGESRAAIEASQAQLRQRRSEALAPELAYREISNAWQLRPRQLGCLQKLAEWRLRQARERDLAVNFVVREENLWQVARYMPSSLGELDSLGLSGPEIRYHGKTLLALVAEAEALDESELPAPLANLIDQPGYKKVFKDIKAAIATVSEQSGLSSELLASRRQINQLLNWHWQLKDGESRPELISGWRGDLLMAPLQDILKDY